MDAWLGKASLGPVDPVGPAPSLPSWLGGCCVDQLSQALTLGKGPLWLLLILLTGLKMHLPT